MANNLTLKRTVNFKVSHTAASIKFYLPFSFALISNFTSNTVSILLMVPLLLYCIYIISNSRIDKDPNSDINLFDRFRNFFKSYEINSEKIVIYNIIPLAFLIEVPEQSETSMDIENIKDYKKGRSLIPGYTCFKFVSENDNVIVLQTKNKETIKNIISKKLIEDL